jgi:hypothetical protein
LDDKESRWLSYRATVLTDFMREVRDEIEAWDRAGSPELDRPGSKLRKMGEWDLTYTTPRFTCEKHGLASRHT